MNESVKQVANIVELEVRVKEIDDLFWGGNSKIRVFSRENVPEHIDCSNPICHGGRILIGEVIRDTLKANKEQMIVNKKCPGYEGSPKGRKRYKSCIHAFEITVHVRSVA